MRRLIISCTMFAAACVTWAQGLPFIKIYKGEDYHAHDLNFDVKVTDDGTLFAANFEGMLYYDNATWRILHTDGNSRITVSYLDKDGVLWVGGYNFFGRVAVQENGELYLQRAGEKNLFVGEVLEIWENDGNLQFCVNNGTVYLVKDGKVTLKKRLDKEAFGFGLTDIIDTEAVDKWGEIRVLTGITHEEPLGNGRKAIVTRGQGVIITDDKGQELYRLSEDNVLSTNNIIWVYYDQHGVLWGATEDGLFSAGIPSAYSHLGVEDGLNGDVLSIAKYNGHIYVGTINGLFRVEGRTARPMKGITHACWALAPTNRGLMVATTNGTYQVNDNGIQRQLTTQSTTALLTDDRKVYTGEIDGVYLIDDKGVRTKVCNLQRVNKFIRDSKGTIWLQSMYGDIWYKPSKEKEFRPYTTGDDDHETVATLVQTGRRVFYVRAENTYPFSYPLFSCADSTGVTWLTNYEGKGIYRWKHDKRLNDLDRYLYPLRKFTVRALLLDGERIWLGGDDGLTIINTSVDDPAMKAEPQMRIRGISLGTDSVIWGGYGKMPETIELSYKNHNLRFSFSLSYESIVGETVYRHRLNGGEWSAWADDHDAEYLNLSPGRYTFEVQGLDAFGRQSDTTSVVFIIDNPFYLTWYMNIVYLLLFMLLVYAFMQMRLRRLEREKMQLETIVEERTEEVRRAHKELVKQEKMATVGKLTQGLIDRILNPLNYINNFSKLSEGLVKDIEANIDDEKDHMDEENYEDTKDVLGMLAGNLQKVGEHGQNTTRTLKAMEEMLKDRSGGIVITDLCSILRQNEEMLSTYYAKDISTYHIRTTVSYPDQPVYIRVNPEQLSKVIMSIIANSVYAVIKRVEKVAKSQESAGSVEPMEISITATVSGDQVTIVARDTGIGIEQNILNKIFDPFFTTKTTGEAAGIGLYLSHEIIQNYGGEISVESVKDVFTAFTIILPIQTAPAYGTTD